MRQFVPYDTFFPRMPARGTDIVFFIESIIPFRPKKRNSPDRRPGFYANFTWKSAAFAMSMLLFFRQTAIAKGPRRRRCRRGKMPGPVSPGQLQSQRKSQTARRHTQRRQAIVHPRPARTEEVGYKTGQQRRLARIKKAEGPVSCQKPPSRTVSASPVFSTSPKTAPHLTAT